MICVTTPNKMPPARNHDARQLVLASMQWRITVSVIWQFASDEASIRHRAASVGVQNRIESIQKQRRIVPDERSYPPNPRAANSLPADFPRPGDARSPIKTTIHAQTSLAHPLRVVMRRSQRRAKEAFTNIMHLASMPGIRCITG